VLGTLEIVLLDSAEPEIYSYANKESCEERVEYRLVLPENDPAVAAAERLARDAWIALGCRDGGRIDLRCDANGQPQFLEANPLAGLHPSHSDLPMLATARGVSYRDLIGRRSDRTDPVVGVDSRSAARKVLMSQRSGVPGGLAAGSRIALLYDELLGETPDLLDGEVQRQAIAQALIELGHEPIPIPCDLDLAAARERLRQCEPALVFNLVESLGGSDRLMPLATLLLESLGLPYTGCSGCRIPVVRLPRSSRRTTSPPRNAACGNSACRLPPAGDFRDERRSRSLSRRCGSRPR